MPESNHAEAKRPKLVGVPGGGAASFRHEPGWSERVSHSGRLLALLALLLLLTVATLVVQVRRVEKLTAEVAALDLQIDAAKRRLAAYEVQRELVRDSLGRVLEQLTTLQSVVTQDPLAVPEPAEAP